MGIDPGDDGVRLLKMKIMREVLSRGIVLPAAERSPEDTPDATLQLPTHPGIDKVIQLFREHGWLESYEFTEMEPWQSCRDSMQEMAGQMPCSAACRVKDVYTCYRESFPIHLLRTKQPFTAEFLKDSDLAAMRNTAKHGYED